MKYLFRLNNLSIHTRLTIYISLLVFIGTFILGFIVFQFTKQKFIEEFRAQLIITAKAGASFLNGDDVKIIKNESDKNKQAYLNLLLALNRVRAMGDKIENIYIMRNTPQYGIVEFVVDTDPKTPAQIGEKFSARSYRELRRGFYYPTADYEFSTDKWGTWLSGYAPIFDRNRNVVGILGIDISVERIKGIIQKLTIIFLISLITFNFITFFIVKHLTFFIVKPLKEFTVLAEEVSVGKQADISFTNQQDEVGVLARSFSKMLQNVNNKEEKLKSIIIQLEQSFAEVITALSTALDAKDSYTLGHSKQVAEYAVEIAKRIGLEQEQIDLLHFAALLHDMGKIGVPDCILGKIGKLTAEERAKIQEHVEIGKSILEKVESLQDVIPSVYTHHERFDGNGYPNGIKGNKIPIGGRILAVADSFQAMTSNRIYRNSIPVEKAIKELVDGKGTQFDPEIVDVFINYLDETMN